MQFKQKHLSRLLLGVIGASAAVTLVGVPAFAQDAAQPVKAGPQKIDKIEVTGSNIKRVDAEGPAPIQIITKEEIERSGKQTVSEILRSLPSNGNGGLNDLSGGNSFSGAASTVSLRGLGSTSTLVLLNGRRIAPLAPADPNAGQASVVNLDSLPVNVIERIEILKDGASAIYGSEAIAGVVNIILRRDYKGAEVGGSFSSTANGNYKVNRANASIGFGDLAKDSYNAFITYERFERKSVGINDVKDYLIDGRLAASPLRTGVPYTSSYAGNYYESVVDNTGLATIIGTIGPGKCVPGSIIGRGGVCRFDLTPRTEIVPNSDRDNIFARGTFDFSGTLQGFAEAGFNRTKTFYKGAPQVYGDFGSWYSGTLRSLVNLPEQLPVGNPSNPYDHPVTYRYRFTDVGNSDVSVVAEATRVLAGLKGTVGPVDWESSILYTENKAENTALNQIRFSVLSAAITNGTYNFLNPTAGSITANNLRINSTDNAKSSYTIVDLKGSSELMTLPAGPLALAAGLEFRREKRVATPDDNKQSGEVVGYGAALATGSRNVTSVYAELSIPILKNLEGQLAFRDDQYSDYGRSTTPKVAFKWSVLPTVALRASYAGGFRAPSLTEISTSSVTAFTTITDPRRCITGDEPDCGRTVAILLQNGDRLQPEKTKSGNVGIVWDITKSASLSLDYFNIRRKNEISYLSINAILANESATSGIYANRVIRGAATGDGLPGPIQALRDFFFNGGKTEINGFDADLRWNFGLGQWGKLSNRLAGTYYGNYKQAPDPTSDLIDYAGWQVPRVRAQGSTNWEFRDWDVGLIGNYVRGYNVSYDPRYACTDVNPFVPTVCRVGSNFTVDSSIQYRGIKNLTLGLLVRNVANRKPPLDPISSYGVNFDNFAYQGRYYTVTANYQFK